MIGLRAAWGENTIQLRGRSAAEKRRGSWIRHRCGTNRLGVDQLRDLPIDEMEVFENGFVTYVRPRYSKEIIATFDCSKK